MARHSLRSSRLNENLTVGQDEDPMSSMGNLMDVMLVFACGLILALIANWGVDLAGVASSVDSSTVEPIEGEFAEVQRGVSEGDANYTELGVVYLEESTGQLYVVSP